MACLGAIQTCRLEEAVIKTRKNYCVSSVLLSEKSRCCASDGIVGLQALSIHCSPYLYLGVRSMSNGYLSSSQLTLLGERRRRKRAEGLFLCLAFGRPIAPALPFHTNPTPPWLTHLVNSYGQPLTLSISIHPSVVYCLTGFCSSQFIPDDLSSPIRCDAGRRIASRSSRSSRYHPQQHGHRTAIVHPVLQPAGFTLLSLQR